MSWTTAGGLTIIGLVAALTTTSLTETWSPAVSRLASLPGLVRSTLPGLVDDDSIPSCSLSLSCSYNPNPDRIESRTDPQSQSSFVAVAARCSRPTKLHLSCPSQLQALESRPYQHPFMNSLEFCTRMPIRYRIMNAIAAIGRNPLAINAIIAPLFRAYYTAAAPDLRAVLDNLALLQRAVVLHDLTRHLHQHLAHIYRRYRYDVRFPVLRQVHEQVAARALDRAYRTLGDALRTETSPDHRHSSMDIICTVLNQGEWRSIPIPIKSMIEEILEQFLGADTTDHHRRLMKSTRVSFQKGFEYQPSPMLHEIYQIHRKVMIMIEALSPRDDTPYLSIYPVSDPKSDYTTRELRDLALIAKRAADTDTGTLAQLNLALESGLDHANDDHHHHHHRQTEVRHLLLQDLIEAQRRLTRAHIHQLCCDLYEGSDPIPDSSHLDLDMALIEIGIDMMIQGDIDADHLYRISMTCLYEVVPALRYQGQQGWEPVFIPLRKVVEFARSVSAGYWPALVVDRDRDGRPLFLYQSNARSGRNLVRKSFVEFMQSSSSSSCRTGPRQ